MATLDVERNVIVIRVVYDGAPGSGKTTSLRSLSRSLDRPLYTPEELGGRTVFFDWMDYTAGAFEGYPVRCQVVSVPGQAVLEARRRWLLMGADAVIFVADTTRGGLDESMAYYGSSSQILKDQDDMRIGVLVQANKRDCLDAVSLDELRHRLGANGSGPGIVESSAVDGDGVRQAFVFGVRLALDRVRAQLSAGRLTQSPPQVDNGFELERELRVAVGGLQAEPPPEKAADPVRPLSGFAQAFAEVMEEQRPSPKLAPVLTRVGGTARPAPLLPDATVPSGAVWPPVEGRLILHELTPNQRPVLLDSGDWVAGEGTPWRLHSRVDDVFASLEQSRSALIPWARLHSATEGLSPQRCITACEVGDGTWRLWQVVRNQRPLGEALADACRPPSNRTVALNLIELTAHVVDASENIVRLSRWVPCTPESLARSADSLVYIGLLPRRGPPAGARRSEKQLRQLYNQLSQRLGAELGERLAGVLAFVERQRPDAAGVVAQLIRMLRGET